MRHIAVTAILIGVFSGQALAQPGGRPFEMRPFERLDQLRKVRMIDELDLKEEQSVRFFARLNDFDKRHREFMKSKHDALDRLEQMIKDSVDAKELEKAFPTIVALEEQMALEKSKFFASLTDILTVTQRAKFLTFERTFDKELRDALRETRKKRMRMDEQ